MQRRCQNMGQSKFRSDRRWGIVRVGVVQDANGRDDGELALVQYKHGMSPWLIGACFSFQHGMS